MAFSFSYDAWGNRTAQTVTAGTGGSWSASYNSSNQVTNTGFSYDSAGNQLNDGINGESYDAENHLVNYDSGAATYTYDAMGRRISKTTSAGTADYFYDSFGRQSVVTSGSTTMVRGEFYAGKRHLGTYYDGTTYFTLNDWLGTERVRTDVNGNVVESCQNTPFGDMLSCASTDPSQLHFTGKERDSESGNDYFGARYYASNYGRFLSPDPLGNFVADSTNPQTWNMYAYTINNPLKYIDPTGTDFCQGGDGSDLRKKNFEHYLSQSGGCRWTPNGAQSGIRRREVGSWVDWERAKPWVELCGKNWG